MCVLTQSRCSCLCMLACASAYEWVHAQVCLRFIVYVCIEDKRRFVVHFHNFLGVNGSRNMHNCCHGSICCLCCGLICLCGYQLLRLSAQLTVSKPVVFQCCLCCGLICLCGYQLLCLSAQLTVSKPVVFQ